MRIETQRWWSPALGQEMEIREYGHAGQPVLAFPSFGGQVGDFEGFGMVESCAALIDDGRLRLIATDGIDGQSWAASEMPLPERANRHEAYHSYLIGELVPWAQQAAGRPTVWTTGCSMGAFHAANLFFRHPHRVSAVIGLSGVYRAPGVAGDHGSDAAYLNSPLDYLPALDDPRYLDQYRRNRLVFAVGQGRWEEPCLADTHELERVLAAKDVSAWFDYWGYDVDHDWAWWRVMLPYFLDQLAIG